MSSKGWDDGTIDYQADRIEELEAINAQLLEALESYLKDFDCVAVDCDMESCGLARAAIAKAKGELP